MRLQVLVLALGSLGLGTSSAVVAVHAPELLTRVIGHLEDRHPNQTSFGDGLIGRRVLLLHICHCEQEVMQEVLSILLPRLVCEAFGHLVE